MQKLPDPIGLQLTLGIKKEHPCHPTQEDLAWGAPKIRDKLIRAYPMIKPPAISTVHAVLDRNGLVKRRKRRRYKAFSVSKRSTRPGAHPRSVTN